MKEERKELLLKVEQKEEEMKEIARMQSAIA